MLRGFEILPSRNPHCVFKQQGLLNPSCGRTSFWKSLDWTGLPSCSDGYGLHPNWAQCRPSPILSPGSQHLHLRHIVGELAWYRRRPAGANLLTFGAGRVSKGGDSIVLSHRSQREIVVEIDSIEVVIQMLVNLILHKDYAQHGGLLFPISTLLPEENIMEACSLITSEGGIPSTCNGGQ